MKIELEIGQILKIDGVLCEVIPSRKCSDCEVQKSTRINGYNMQCGKRYNGNTSVFSCSKDVRKDKTNIIFRKIYEPD